MGIEINEGLIRSLALKEKTISDGRTLAAKGAYKNPARTEDGTLYWAHCQGSTLYNTSIDLAGDKPIPRCSCPVKPPPCKHVLGLLVHLLEQPAKFKVGEPPADLSEKRAKAQDRAEEKAEVVAKPKEVNKAALAKKTSAQAGALDLLEMLVLDLASAGLGNLDARRAGKLSEQAKQLNDAYLKGAAVAVTRLAALAAEERLGDEDRRRLMVRHLVRLWAMVKRGRKHLEAKLEEGETQQDADAVLEELLGHDWKLVELKERGFVRQNLELLELAFERHDDEVRDERIEQSLLLELSDGALYADLNMRPLAALDKTREKESYTDLLQIAEAAVYPGFVNRRVRWELPALKRRAPAAADWERVHKAAVPIDAALAKFKEQIRNPLAPWDAALLIRAREFVSGPVLVDEKGGKLALRDAPLARVPTAELLARAAGGLAGPLSCLVRFWTGLSDNAVRAQPLALVAGPRLLRLCM